jgi:hypothetical protein
MRHWCAFNNVDGFRSPGGSNNNPKAKYGNGLRP